MVNDSPLVMLNTTVWLVHSAHSEEQPTQAGVNLSRQIQRRGGEAFSKELQYIILMEKQHTHTVKYTMNH